MTPNSIADSMVGLSLDTESEHSFTESSNSSLSLGARAALSPTAEQMRARSFEFMSSDQLSSDTITQQSKRPRRVQTGSNQSLSESESESKPPALSPPAKSYLERLKQRLGQTDQLSEECAQLNQQRINERLQSEQNLELAWRMVKPSVVPAALSLASQSTELNAFRNSGTHQFASHREVWAQRLLCDVIEANGAHAFNPQPIPRVMAQNHLDLIRLAIRNSLPSLDSLSIDRLTIRLALQMGSNLGASGVFGTMDHQGVYHLEPLFQAHFAYRADLVQALILEGANIHQHSSNPHLQGQTIFEHAQRNGASEQYLGLLRELGA